VALDSDRGSASSGSASPGASGQGEAPETPYVSGAKKRLGLLLILGFPTFMFLAAGVRAIQLAGEGEVPAEWRDLDCDGKVSAVEWLRGGIDFRLRPSTLVPGCQELVHAKAGEVAVVRCETEPKCRTAKDLRATGAK
jgi:hypothetical protein